MDPVNAGPIPGADKCFWVWEANSTSEETPDKEILLFYHSETVIDLRKFLALHSGCAHWLHLIPDILSQQPRIIRFQTFKVGLKHIPKCVLFLTSNLETSDLLLLRMMDDLAGALCFYEGPTQDLFQRSVGDGTRTSLQNNLRPAFIKLLPIIKQFHATSPANAFDLLPFTHTPTTNTSLFIHGSQILCWLARQPGILGGCLIFENSILSSTISESLTLYLLNLIAALQQASGHVQGDSQSRLSIIQGPPASNSNPNIASSLLTNQSNHGSNNNLANVTQNNVLGSLANPLSTSAPSGSMIGTMGSNSNLQSSLSSNNQTNNNNNPALVATNSGNNNNNNNNTNMSNPHFSHFSAPEAEDYPIWAFVSESEYKRLGRKSLSELKLKQPFVLFEQERPGIAAVQDGAGCYVALYIRRLSSLALALFVDLPNTDNLQIRSNITAASEQSLITLQDLLSKGSLSGPSPFHMSLPPTQTDPKIASEPPYSIAIFDNIRKTLKGTVTHDESEFELERSPAIKLAHNIFANSPETSSIYLRDEIGDWYGRHTFDKETYLHVAAQERIIPGKIEKYARIKFTEDQNLYFL